MVSVRSPKLEKVRYFRFSRKSTDAVMSTSMKHREFIAEPMAEKEVTAIAGTGPAYGAKLAENGFHKAYIFFGQFLLLKKDEDLFTERSEDTTGVSANHAKNAYNCLNAWAEQYI